MSHFPTDSSGVILPRVGPFPRPTIFFLVKFLSKERHVECFLNGKLYAQRLASFKEIEDDAQSGRFDPHEGTSSWMQPGQVRIVINGMDLSSDLAGPVQTQMDWCDQLNVFCVHAAHTGELDVEQIGDHSIEQLRQQLWIPDACFDLGPYAVVITDIAEFMRRFGAAVGSRGYRAWADLVRYYDPDTFHGHFEGIDPVFRKQSRFSEQREYRFAIDTGTAGRDALTLEIGDIRDITLRFRSPDLNSVEFLGGTMGLERSPAR